MTTEEIITWVIGIIGSCIVVEIVPVIKINPITWICSKIGEKLMDSALKKMDEKDKQYQKQFDTIVNEFRNFKGETERREKQLVENMMNKMDVRDENYEKKFKDISDILENIKKEMELGTAKSLRWEILSFANSCYNGVKHRKDEFIHIFDCHDRYEKIIKKYNMANGIINEEFDYILELYHECLSNHSFLERKD